MLALGQRIHMFYFAEVQLVPELALMKLTARKTETALAVDAKETFKALPSPNEVYKDGLLVSFIHLVNRHLLDSY